MTLFLASLIALAAVTPAQPMKLTGAVADSARAAIEKDRNDTREWLRSKMSSYLATIQRRDFEDETTMTVGSARGNDVRIKDDTVEPNHLRVTVVGDSFHVEAIDEKAYFRIDDEKLREATLPASRVWVGRFNLRLTHQRFPAIIVFDPESPRFKEYKGIEYFPIDLSYAYEIPLTPNPEPDTVIILATRGNQRRALRVGWFHFEVDGEAVSLEATRLLEPGVGEEYVGVYFRDATCGEESYELGRYVNPVKLDNGNYVIDFNMAYSPACAYSVHYNCPIPPKGNRLKVAIRAGEKDSHYMH